MKVEPVSVVRPLSPGMRLLLLLASGLVYVAGFQLFILTQTTDRFFAWTVEPPLTAAFLGAAYWSSCILEYLASRERAWARARVAVPAVLLFTALTFVVTLLHLDRFHLDLNSQPFYTVALAWVWIAIYASVPIALTILLILQLRIPGDDPPRQHPLPRWLRGLLAVQSLVMLVFGAALLLFPTIAIAFWPWTTGALSAQAIGAWLLGLGIAAAHTAWENELTRAYPALASMIVLALLEGIALLRFPEHMLWGTMQAWGYLVFLVSILVVGIVGVLLARQVRQPA